MVWYIRNLTLNFISIMSQQSPVHSSPILIVLIILLIALTQMTTDQYIPSLPAITKAFNTSEASIQLTLTLFMLGLSISHLFYGPLSDRIGRKPPLAIGVGLSILGSLCCYLTPSVSFLIVGRFIQGFGIGCCSSVGRSLVRDLYTDRVLAKMGSYVGVASVFIMASSPTLGGYIQEQWGWRANFLFLFLLGIILWVSMLLILPETNRRLNPEATRIRVMGRNYLELLRSKVFLGYTLCACFAGAGLIAYITIAPFLFQDTLGLSPLQFGRLTFFIAGAICFSGLINGVLVMHKGVSYMVFVGVVFMLLGGISLIVVTFQGDLTVLRIMIPITLFSTGAGFTFINAFAGAFHPFPHMAGMVGALYASLQDLSAASASGIIAASRGYGMTSLAIIILSLGFSSLAAWYYCAQGEKTV